MSDVTDLIGNLMTRIASLQAPNRAMSDNPAVNQPIGFGDRALNDREFADGEILKQFLDHLMSQTGDGQQMSAQPQRAPSSARDLPAVSGSSSIGGAGFYRPGSSGQSPLDDALAIKARQMALALLSRKPGYF